MTRAVEAKLTALREPALGVMTLLPGLVATLLLFFADLSPDAQAAWNAAALAASGLVTAALVARDKLAPAILGFAQAMLALLTVHGFQLTAAQSTGVMAFVSLAVGMYVRTQVTAKVSVTGQRRGRHAAPDEEVPG
jgi:hypothetical protein